MTDIDSAHIHSIGKSDRRIDSRDVLDPNARTVRNFRARILGHFRRVGPNPWDDYVFESIADGETVDVLADVPIEVEADDAAFRMRRHGEVERLVWEPGPAETPSTGDPVPADAAQVRALFLTGFVRAFTEAQGIGGAAVIAGKLASTPPKPSLD